MSKPQTHFFVPTPNPAVVGLRVLVKQSVLAADPSILPAEGMLYKDFAQRVFPKDYIKECADYRYVDCGNGGGASPSPSEAVPGVMKVEGMDAGSTLSLLFLPNLSDEQKGTPYRTLSYFGNHRWPPILKFLKFIQDPVFTRSTNGRKAGQAAIITGPTYYVRIGYIPEVNEGTLFIQREYFSDTPYDVQRSPIPTPTAIFYDMPGIRGSFEECLHGDIEIPESQSATSSILIGDSTAATITGNIPGQFYPRTNFTEWAPYFLTQQQVFDNGYKLTTIQVFPPDVPKISIR